MIILEQNVPLPIKPKKFDRKEYNRINVPKWNKANPAIRKGILERCRYGVTSAQLAKEQNGLCAICGDELDMGKRTHIDHVKGTKSARGLLCRFCNNGIAFLKHSPKVLQAAIAYLEKHQSKGELL